LYKNTYLAAKKQVDDITMTIFEQAFRSLYTMPGIRMLMSFVPNFQLVLHVFLPEE
jgi:hypothetical protein